MHAAIRLLATPFRTPALLRHRWQSSRSHSSSEMAADLPSCPDSHVRLLLQKPLLLILPFVRLLTLLPHGLTSHDDTSLTITTSPVQHRLHLRVAGGKWIRFGWADEWVTVGSGGVDGCGRRSRVEVHPLKTRPIASPCSSSTFTLRLSWIQNQLSSQPQLWSRNRQSS